MRMRVSPYVTTTVGAGPAGETVIANEASGAYFLADNAMVRFLELVRKLGSIDGAGQALGLEPEVSSYLQQTLIENGVLISDDPNAEHEAKPRKRPPLESQLLFFRIELFDLRRSLAFVYPMLRLVFTPIALAVWVALIAYAGAILARNAEQAVADLSALSMSPQTVIILGGLFLVLKGVHEFGHAAAYRVFCHAEGLPTGPIQAGICIFAGAPFPFTNVTGAWRLKSRWRRAAIGAAGVYVETFIAAIAVILWAGMTPGELKTAAIQLALISGVSTLVFNLNPLVRLDGYFIFSDLLGAPNLATRASMAARSVGLWLLGGVWRTAPVWRLVYWVASYAYRWVIFAGIFWIAYSVDPRLAAPVALITIVLLIARPVWSVLKSVSVRTLGLRGWVSVLLVTGFTLFAAIWPLPTWSVAEGQLERFEDVPVFAPSRAIVEYVAEAGEATGEVLRFNDPRLATDLAENALAGQRAAIAIRAAGAVSPSAEKRMREEMETVEAQAVRLEHRRSQMTVQAEVGDIWSPNLAAKRNLGWVQPVDRELGVLSRPIEPRMIARLAQADRIEFAVKEGAILLAKGGWRETCAFKAIASRGLAVASIDGFYEIEARLPSDAPDCAANLPHGAAIMIRLDEPDATLLSQFWRAAVKLAQSRLPIG